MHVVHCPRSHAYFGHAPFPYETLSKASVNICLGTDRLATVKKERNRPPELNMFAEMRAFAAAYPGASPETILRMVTINPARALGRAAELGQLSPNACADMIALKYTGPVNDARSALLQPKPQLTATIINGGLLDKDHAVKSSG